MESVHVLIFLIAGCTSVFGYKLEKEPKCSKFDYEEKMLEKMVRIEHAMELMNEKLEHNQKSIKDEFDAKRAEFEAMRGEFDVIKQSVNETVADSLKKIKEEFDVMRGEFDVIKQSVNETVADSLKTMKEELYVMRGEFDAIKQNVNEKVADSLKTMKEEFDTVRGEFEAMKLPMKEDLDYLKQRIDGPHAFQVLRSKNITSNGYGFLILEVRVPANGISRSSNWCFDYRNLCESFNRRPTGCGETWRAYSPYEECQRIYNSDTDIGDTLVCDPSRAIAKLAVKAFSNPISQTDLWKYSFGFYKCRSQDCSVNLEDSRNALYDTAAFKEGHLTFYTVCR